MHLNDFARSGYRTLCFAYKNISESFYNKWKDEYLKASTVLINRESAKNKVAEKIEKKLTLIGVTAIENKLQDNVSYLCLYRFLIRLRGYIIYYFVL